MRELSFSGPHILALSVDRAEGFPIEGRTIVLNPSPVAATLDQAPRRAVLPLTSTILQDVRVLRADKLLLLRLRDEVNLGNIFLEEGWDLYGDLAGPGSEFPANTPLWRSPVDSLGAVELDPLFVTGQVAAPGATRRFEVKVNLWFSPARTNCYIHNRHDFLEVHTQVSGLGRMQKFKTRDPGSLYEDMLMAPGYTTPVPFGDLGEDGRFVYPWHQYHADTDCVWLAVEYHLV